MATLFQLHAPAPISYTLAKTLNPIFPFHNTIPFSPPILCALSRRKSFSVPRRSLPPSVLRYCAGKSSGSVDDEEGSEEFDQLDYSDNDDVDVNALEQEAKDAVQAYSSSLSQILSIEDEKNDREETAQSHKRSKQRKKIQIPDNLLPRVAIVGRPNVGKSALFNRLVGAGLTAADVEIADWLRKNYSNKCVILAVNKCESPRKRIMQVSEFWSLGFEPIPVSAITGTGTGDLLDLACSGLQKVEEPENIDEEDYVPAISIVGRPNVGKSSILNALVGEDRTIVSPVSGTTRDAIDTEFTGADGQKFRLIDTAGIRKRASVASAGSTTEALSVNRAFRAIRRSDVVALVIEAMACITEQDYKIAERIEKEGKGCVIVVNKWDTIPNKNQQTAAYYEQDVREKLRKLDWAPIVYSTAIAGHSVDKIIDAASEVEKERSRRLGTSILNQVVQEAVAFKPPPRTRGGKRGRVYYCTQAAIRPPTFVFFVNDAKLFPETFRRYVEKQLRSDAGFYGTPIRLMWRSRRKMGKDEGKAVTRTQDNLTSRDQKLVSTTP
ncbi:uncharacterized protein LOC133295412 isoform X3 [Gastrolobium bilobum]|uniref:uncharacterized protein LOC133295412 isoform X3 n=1 Tax=Gastrolobium bilobum TaxID=150636 RepID=UPI002AB071D0|nr:uncharacterized protein LOC133295412 isoform X3 [Gastrolobium bilobum]